ncbi:SpoIIE family protein phosphatase [Pontiella agarivorans]|uniref:SpoIIE family protein phosphatase n=1 Tax=Pontiella agarivorans TaxID=3038953 RepID=A0ABU5MU30_9BACT|nr:SpoIIE family protein phosphatase [Pontiella agarivorans]MDZ8117719.1 SpoIIE family protein phosphatase [Pontiella agarivorans]
MKNLFTELEFYQVRKASEHTAGDAFMVQKDPESHRLLAVLSDGLGSGVKANILANMTASMAIKFADSYTDFVHYAQIIMNSLPVCRVRRIAYATFTVIDCHPDGFVQIVEQGNPPFILLRNGKAVKVPCREFAGDQDDYRKLRVSRFTAQPEDRIIFFSDGVTEAGMGSPKYPLGWRLSGCTAYTEEQVQNDTSISARRLARSIVQAALQLETGYQACDDITSGVLYFRTPRRTLLASGPPFSEKKDREYAEIIRRFDGTKIVSGGTSADIVARELKREIQTDLFRFKRSSLPPVSTLDGIDLVTEGILTLTEVLNLLEKKKRPVQQNAATLLCEHLLNSDLIHLLVGTRINQAHQDPSLPMELEIRRSLLRRIATVLEEHYLKEVTLEFI